MAKIILVDLHVCGVVFRAAERIVGARGKYENWANIIGCVKGVWGHAPRKFCDFTCSEVCSGGFRGSFSIIHKVHKYLPVAVFL